MTAQIGEDPQNDRWARMQQQGRVI